jgi:hypothetical protein
MATPSEAGQSVVIEVSSGVRTVPNRKLAGTIQERIGKSLTLLTDEKIAESAAVWVQGKNLLSLGEVQSSVCRQGAQWTVHVRVNRSMLIV